MIPGIPYWVYSNAYDFAVAAILQQVQPIKVGDLKRNQSLQKMRKRVQER